MCYCRSNPIIKSARESDHAPGGGGKTEKKYAESPAALSRHRCAWRSKSGMRNGPEAKKIGEPGGFPGVKRLRAG